MECCVTQCNGQYPECARCQASGVKCIYDIAEGITKMQNIQQKLDSKTGDLDRAMAVLCRLQQGTDEEASEVLARLRLGESVENLANYFANQGSLNAGYVNPPQRAYACMHTGA